MCGISNDVVSALSTVSGSFYVLIYKMLQEFFKDFRKLFLSHM